MKKKILFVITKSNWGGAQRYVFDLATNLPKDEFEVTVALGGTGLRDASTGKLMEKLKEANIKTIFIKSFMRNISLLKEFQAFFELLKIFKKEKPDIAHLNSSKAGGTGGLAARIVGIKKIIFTSHGWAFNEERPILEKLAIKFLQWLTIILSHKTICISKSEFEEAMRLPFTSAKISLIYNGISPISFGSGEIIRDAFPPNSKITGTIGELHKNKNQIALIEEAHKNPNMCVAIIGEGEERPNLEAKIKEYNLENRVKLFGFLPASEALKGFDEFALPSIKEGLPYVLLEAREANIPILKNDRVPAIREINEEKDPKAFSISTMLRKTITLYQS